MTVWDLKNTWNKCNDRQLDENFNFSEPLVMFPWRNQRTLVQEGGKMFPVVRALLHWRVELGTLYTLTSQWNTLTTTVRVLNTDLTRGVALVIHPDMNINDRGSYSILKLIWKKPFYIMKKRSF